jgi:hypothetical protein
MRVNANLKPDDDSFEIGKKAEDLFVEVCGKKGYEAIKSSKRQDMYDHIDYHVKNKAGDMKSFDVKSRKRTSRTLNLTMTGNGLSFLMSTEKLDGLKAKPTL